MSIYKPWGAPSRAELMAQAVQAQLVADLAAPAFVVKRRSNINAIRELVQAADWAKPGRALIVQLRGPRRKEGSEEVKGATQDLWLVGLPIAIVVFDTDADTRGTTLDAAEVAVANSMHQLESNTDFAALARDVEFDGFEPASIEAEGDVPPHAASVGSLTATVWE